MDILEQRPSPRPRFDRLATSYDQLRAIPPAALEAIADGVIRLGGARPTSHFFEPGIGTGRIAIPVVRRGYRYTGLDVSAPMLTILIQGGLPGCDVVHGDVRALPFADASFDIALSTHLLYLVTGWPGALAEIRRVLRPGGAYLHCFEASTGTLAALAIAEQWRAAVGAVSAESTWPETTTDADVLTSLYDSGAVVESAVAARWCQRRTVVDFLAGYPDRVRPLYPSISDDTFAGVAEQFDAWVRRTFPPDAEVGHDIRFEVHAAHWYH